jgi:hypothetical protein
MQNAVSRPVLFGFLTSVLLAFNGVALGTSPTAAQASRLITAKTVCSSRESAVHYAKGQKPPYIQHYLVEIDSAVRLAANGIYELGNCNSADLVIRIEINLAVETTTLTVTDADNGETLWYETRAIADVASDLSHMAQKFHDTTEDYKRKADRCTGSATYNTARDVCEASPRSR